MIINYSILLLSRDCKRLLLWLADLLYDLVRDGTSLESQNDVSARAQAAAAMTTANHNEVTGNMEARVAGCCN